MQPINHPAISTWDVLYALDLIYWEPTLRNILLLNK